MSSHTVDTATAKRLVEAAAIRGASIVGQPGGWSVVLKLGLQEQALSTQRTGQPRTWRSLDRCVEFLRRELQIARYTLDATHYSDAVLGRTTREDSAERLRRAHAAAAHDAWFHEQVAAGVAEADAPGAEWVTNEEANASWAKRRAALAKRAEGAA